MKKILLSFLIIFFSTVLFAQEQVLNSFDQADPDTNYWAYFDNHGGQHYQTSASADSAKGWINISYPTEYFVSGSGSMRLDYSAQNIESWGGYTKLEHWNPDSNGVYDWSLYDTLSVWYFNVVPQSESGRIHLRINLHDVSDATTGNKTYDVTQVEYYYSFQYILDNEPGWNELKIPLVNNANWDGNGFNLTGWSGIAGNSTLDLDKIKGYSLEFSINGSGDGDFVTGSVILDQLALKGAAENSVVFFNGAAIPSVMEQFVWGGSTEIVLGAGHTASSPNAIKWVQSDAWSGTGFNFGPVNLSLRWDLDSLKFYMKTEVGTGKLRLQWEDGTAKVGLNFDPIADNEWHLYSFPLNTMTTEFDGTTGFNNKNVVVFQILTEGTGSGKVAYLDDWWTGNPSFDVVAPAEPALVTAAGGDFVNLVTWTDVPGESKEVYDVYYSLNEITDLTAPGVEVVQFGVEEGLQVVEHVLIAPATNQELTFHYAVVCKDAAGNASGISKSDPITNTAKGTTVIHPTAPSNFVADGDLSEWSGITPFRMYSSDGSGSIVTNQVIDGDNDASADAYVAMDGEYLYVAYNVNDDIVSSDSTIASYLRDAADLFIALYDWHGPSHTSLKRGEEPDYQFRFNKESAIIGTIGDYLLARPGEDYAWVEKFPSGYTVEGKFSFAEISAAATPDDALFSPRVGKRIKIDFAINDADATGSREGILTYSPKNEDKSYQDVSRWVYTWIGTEMTVDVEDTETLPSSYSLYQNYPNPFNPTTNIKFSIPQSGIVTLKIFNVLGQEVAVLNNNFLQAGTHNFSFDAGNLSSGVYIYQITANNFVSSKKMLLIK
ncbi:MAG: T9SS type A sorting domain-containing protein [Bacteroidetes bacterium]|nr:T9SS type A sorting domain-containing protein [Bacteroidota bacterium]